MSDIKNQAADKSIAQQHKDEGHLHTRYGCMSPFLLLACLLILLYQVLSFPFKWVYRIVKSKIENAYEKDIEDQDDKEEKE